MEALLRDLYQGLDAGRRAEDRAATLAAAGALAALGVHSWFDFGLTTAANAVTLAVLCGAAVGVTGRSDPRKVRPFAA